MMRLFLFITISLFLTLPTLAHAACTSPAGVEGTTRYDSTAKKMYYCNNTSWVEMGGGGSTNLQQTTVTCSYTGDSSIDVNQLHQECTTPSCPTGYTRSGCSARSLFTGNNGLPEPNAQPTAAFPSGTSACTCMGYSTKGDLTCYAYCIKTQ